ncbi:peptidoglycan-binding domain-containing protein [Streptomyces sp. NPDC093111]|uniref:peptidoglycan-binding domain-containing protein n=1 Tax=Streptomyces sp. NPDC093111 TaxID=3154978 RepID=UPI003423FFD8
MRNRTALTPAVTSSAPEPQSHPGRDGLVFGMVAGPGADGPGARDQDVELFDTTPTLPRAPREGRSRGRHVAEKSRHGRNASRTRKPVRKQVEKQATKQATKQEREQGAGLALPLLIAGALAAGIGLTVGFTSGLEQQTPDDRSLMMPDLLPPSSPAASEPPVVTHVSTPPRAPATRAAATATGPGPTPSHASATPRTPARTTAPPPPVTPPTSSPNRPSPPPQRPDGDVLRRGSTGPEVKELQRCLGRLHLYLGSVDGSFGAYLEAALIRFQASRSITEELGVYGPVTRAALRSEADREAGSDRDPWGGWDDVDRGGWGGVGRDGWGD